MNARRSLLLVALVAAAPLVAQTLYHDVRAQVVVLDAEAAGRRLTEWAEAAGGYYLSRSSAGVVLRVPAARIAELKPVLEDVAEVVLSYRPSATDVREELGAVQSSITSTREALELILSYVDEADVVGTLALEQEIAQLVTQMERLEGRRRKLTNDAAYARVEVVLSSRRQSVPEQRPSSFDWINTVDLYRFLGELGHGY